LLEVRVSSAERGWARIDRGTSDGLIAGDTVVFHPRGGGTHLGTVVELEERAARVELRDPDFVPASGTRGQVELPRARAKTPQKTGRRPAPKRANDPRGEPVFENPDADWQSGEPLLARVRPVRPAERPVDLHGRLTFAFDGTRASEDDRHDTFARVGESLVIENPFHGGGRLAFDAEWNYRHVDVPDFDDERGAEFRLERLAYVTGDTRFDQDRLAFGRFLQEGMSEFGVLDGVEWRARRRNGHRYGLSAGFMPEPDEDFQSGQDLQFAGFYDWVGDESEQLRAAVGYQKTLHNGAVDRDLLVVRCQRLPRHGWSLFSSLWLDYYTGSDDEKGSTLGVTQANLSLGRRFEGGSTLDLAFRHLEFPLLERDEFLPVTDAQLADDHHERLTLTSRLQATRDVRVLTSLGVWNDEDDQGGDGEFGLGWKELFPLRAFLDTSLYGTRGQFQTSLGTRLSLGFDRPSGRWALDYEFAQNRLDGFSSANDDLPTHRVRFHADHVWNLWSLSWRLEGLLYDDESALQLGLYLQRSHD
jgi:hypothetical protein